MTNLYEKIQKIVDGRNGEIELNYEIDDTSLYAFIKDDEERTIQLEVEPRGFDFTFLGDTSFNSKLLLEIIRLLLNEGFEFAY